MGLSVPAGLTIATPVCAAFHSAGMYSPLTTPSAVTLPCEDANWMHNITYRGSAIRDSVERDTTGFEMHRSSDECGVWKKEQTASCIDTDWSIGAP
jgi:hypothetical protein